jgi:hydrogenase maturation protease
MARILIIGIGNSLRSDDGVGWHVASELSGRLSASDADVIVLQQLMPEIAEPISRAEKVLFVDALQGGKPGSVRVQRIVPAAESRLDSHRCTPASILKLALELYDRSPEAFLITIAGESFDSGEELSAAVQEALPAVREAIERFLSWARKGDRLDAEFLNGLTD